MSFMQDRWHTIDWSVGPGQIVALVLLLFWLWMAWPKEELLQLKRDKSLQTRLFITAFAINGLWLLNASITAGIHVHFLGIVVFMLMFGWRLATLAILLPVAFFSTFVMQKPFDAALYGFCLLYTSPSPRDS